MSINVPTLPALPEYPAAGTDAERAQWLSLASLHMSAARIAADQARMDQFTAGVDKFVAEFAKHLPPMGAMEFTQAVHLLELFASAKPAACAPASSPAP